MYQEHREVAAPAVVEQKSLKRRWIEELRSGRYTKVTNGFGHGFNRCAFGVLADIQGKHTIDIDKTGILSSADYQNVVLMNDVLMNTFDEIADYVEEHGRD